MIINNRYIIEDLLYCFEDRDFYMKAYDVKNKNYCKIKITKDEFIKWCKSLEDDEQGWMYSEYLNLIH